MFGYTVKSQRRQLGKMVGSITLFIIYCLFNNGARAGAVAAVTSPFRLPMGSLRFSIDLSFRPH